MSAWRGGCFGKGPLPGCWPPSTWDIVGSEGPSGGRLGSSGIQERKLHRRVGPDATGYDQPGEEMACQLPPH